MIGTPQVTVQKTDAIAKGFVVGVDFGQSKDYTAIVINEWKLAIETTFERDALALAVWQAENRPKPVRVTHENPLCMGL